MHFNKMIIAGLLVCCSLTAVACGKNRENTSVVTSEYNAANVKDYEEDGVKYREETGAKQTIIYPLMEHDCADMEQAAVCSINGKQSETDVRDKDTSYIIISSFKWPVLYNDDDVEKIVYKTYNAPSSSPAAIESAEYPVKVPISRMRRGRSIRTSISSRRPCIWPDNMRGCTTRRLVSRSSSCSNSSSGEVWSWMYCSSASIICRKIPPC